jgi:hypothetical protein
VLTVIAIAGITAGAAWVGVFHDNNTAQATKSPTATTIRGAMRLIIVLCPHPVFEPSLCEPSLAGIRDRPLFVIFVRAMVGYCAFATWAFADYEINALYSHCSTIMAQAWYGRSLALSWTHLLSGCI